MFRAKRLRFSAHNEHLKPQSLCRQELVDAGLEPGVDLGDDINHQNIVAALLVSGHGAKVALEDLFGAARRTNQPLAIDPTNAVCETAFEFQADGRVRGTTDAGRETLTALHLGHQTLSGWRKQAIRVFVDAIQNRADAELILDRTTNPTNGILPEYAFAIRQVVIRMLEHQP